MHPWAGVADYMRSARWRIRAARLATSKLTDSKLFGPLFVVIDGGSGPLVFPLPLT